MNRIFISYRSADGTKDASRLADDLGDVFGAEQVFLDRHDLRGGGSWREAIASAIGKRPVVLLLITPAFFGARHDDGHLRIEDADDPVRGEIQSAIAAGATLMPLRVDGAPMPTADSLPEPLRSVTEWHALPLRTDDWSALDLPRVVADIERLGVPRAAPEKSAGTAGKRRLVLSSGIALAAVAGAGILLRSAYPPVDATAPLSVVPNTLDGDWFLVSTDGQRTPAHLRQRGDTVELRTEPVRIDSRPEWANYIASLAADGTQLSHVRYTARGEIFGDELDMALMLISGDGSFEVAGGNLHVRKSADARILDGKVSLNTGDEEVVRLERAR
ncbi:TIR domain protein [Methyloversatilis sp. RAC08]|uniref:toll/interleukin-1 receptor domain-containing protein n=1 Tax=Methyloversatilis sp. RAC08 TaxID=1842540 RepID=UPI00083D633B|nr:toll/interleukin-1 receptor domain-containing protein [Methyloversatilis sp. RAC08]AOF81055.1 TIR domain protein [Methyloversatilis sp. RAC08]